MKLAPVLLFTYKRLEQTRQTVYALQENFLAAESELFIFSDGPKAAADHTSVKSVRDFLKSISGFKKITILESEKNMGLADSIINGVTRVINEYGQAIVLEDDLVTSTNFLTFSNQALQYYKDTPEVFSVGGYTRRIKGLKYDETYFTRRATSWGWATWKEKWNEVDWQVNDYDLFSKDRVARRAFNQMGSDMASMLDRQMRGEINSWAIRWCYHQFKGSLLTVFPAVSKISNIGFTEEATHTKDKFNRFRTELDDTNNTAFRFSNNLSLDEKIVKQFTKPFSIPERIKYKLLNTLPKF